MHCRIVIYKIVMPVLIKNFNVLIHRVSRCIAIIGCTDLNSMAYILIIL